MKLIALPVYDPGPPVTVRGITYPTEDAAASALGVTRKIIDMARQAGWLDGLGLPPLRRHIRQSVETVVRNHRYPSRAAAGRAIGVTRMAVSAAARRGTLDRVGLCGNQPVVIRGVRYKNRRDAAFRLGVHYVHLCRQLVLDKTEFLGLTGAAARRRCIKYEGMEFSGFGALADHLDISYHAARRRAYKRGLVT